MARKSTRISAGAHKRMASSTAIPVEDPKRTKTSKATPTKSQYFKGKESEGGDDAASDSSTDGISADDDASDFGATSGKEDASEPDDEDDEGASDEESDAPKASGRKKGAKVSGTSMKARDLWQPGVKTGLGPGQQVVIKKPKARAAGNTPYTDDTIHPNTLLFLRDLKANNNRPWLKLHDADFRKAEQDWYSFVEKLIDRLTEIDDTVPELPVKDVIFRIYRDVRFSPDPTPYKPYFSAAMSRTGRKGPYAHYYIQVAPNNETFVGGGLWHPDAAPTGALRTVIDRHPQRLKAVLLDDRMRKEFLKGAPKVDAKVVKAFVATNAENALKTKPKGYAADHADIDLLRLRNYTVGRKVTDAELLGSGGIERIAELFGALKPFITFLNSIVMPDPDDAESSEEEDGDEDEDEKSEGTDS